MLGVRRGSRLMCGVPFSMLRPAPWRLLTLRLRPAPNVRDCGHSVHRVRVRVVSCKTIFGCADLRALLLTVQTLPVADETAFGAIAQNCRLYTSWNVGSFATEIGVFVNVLEYTGNIQFRFASDADAGAGVLIEGPAAQGWRHLHSSTAGWRGCQQSFFTGEGRIRVAFALPYQSFGNHSGVPVWSVSTPHSFWVTRDGGWSEVSFSTLWRLPSAAWREPSELAR